MGQLRPTYGALAPRVAMVHMRLVGLRRRRTAQLRYGCGGGASAMEVKVWWRERTYGCDGRPRYGARYGRSRDYGMRSARRNVRLRASRWCANACAIRLQRQRQGVTTVDAAHDGGTQGVTTGMRRCEREGVTTGIATA